MHGTGGAKVVGPAGIGQRNLDSSNISVRLTRDRSLGTAVIAVLPSTAEGAASALEMVGRVRMLFIRAAFVFSSLPAVLTKRRTASAIIGNFVFFSIIVVEVFSDVVVFITVVVIITVIV
jgi:hypothetical protein